MRKRRQIGSHYARLRQSQLPKLRKSVQESHTLIGDVVRRQKMKTEIETLEILQPGEGLQCIVGIEPAIGSRCPHRTGKIKFPQCGEPSDSLQFLRGSQRTNKIQRLDLEIACRQLQ